METTNKLLIVEKTLTDGGLVYDGEVHLDLNFITQDDAVDFACALRELVRRHTNDEVRVSFI